MAQVFDDVTNKYVYTDSLWNKTIHYYNGWKTNNSFRINKKVILRCCHEHSYDDFPDSIKDLNIIFENLSGQKDDIYKDNKVWESIRKDEKDIETLFFKLDSFKKGTLHVTFKDEELLKQFNILAAKGKCWLPGDFGQKSYSDMDEEEKKLVKEFGLTVEDYIKLSATGKKKDYLRLT